MAKQSVEARLRCSQPADMNARSSEMLQKDTETQEKKQLQEEIRDLQTALELCQHEVSQLKGLLQEKTEELHKAVKKRQTRTIAYIDVMNELNVAQAALEESTHKCEALEQKQQEKLEENLQLHHRELEDNRERFRRELSDETEKLRKELSDREEAFKSELWEKERAFQKTLQALSEQWQARAEEWAKKERQLEEMLLNMDTQELDELQLNPGNGQKKKRRIWRVWKWKIWRRFK